MRWKTQTTKLNIVVFANCSLALTCIPRLLKQPPKSQIKVIRQPQVKLSLSYCLALKKKQFWPCRWSWQDALSRLCILVKVKKGTYKCEPFTKGLKQPFPGKQCAKWLKSFRSLTKSSRHLPKLPSKFIWTVGCSGINLTLRATRRLCSLQPVAQQVLQVPSCWIIRLSQFEECLCNLN